MKSAVFWSAFREGLAAPVGLYAQPRPYMAYVTGSSVPGSFSIVAMLLNKAGSQIRGTDEPTAVKP